MSISKKVEKQVIETNKKLVLDDEMIQNLDNLNFEELVKDFEKSHGKQIKEAEKSDRLYREVQTQKSRGKLRKILYSYCSSLHNAMSKNDKSLIISVIKDFDKYYKEHYFVNDYSQDSLCGSSMSPINKEMVNKFLDRVKLIKGIN